MKKLSLVLALILSLSLSGCAAQGTASSGSAASGVSSDASSDESDKTLSVGDTGTLKDWEITVTDFAVTDKIKATYGSFSPDEGNQYAVVTVTVTNKGKQSDIFLPTYNLGKNVSAKIIYDGEYEYSASNLLGYSEDMHDATLNPLVEKSGQIAFQIPDAVADGDESLVLTFSLGLKELSFTLR